MPEADALASRGVGRAWFRQEPRWRADLCQWKCMLRGLCHRPRGDLAKAAPFWRSQRTVSRGSP